MTTIGGCRGGGVSDSGQSSGRGVIWRERRAVIGRAMGWRRKAVTNYCRLRGGKGIGRWWDEKIKRVEEAGCPRCGEGEEMPEHIVFRCGNIRRVKDEKGRREWARKEGMR